MNTLIQAINKASVRTKKNGLIKAREFYVKKKNTKQEVPKEVSNLTLNEVMRKWLATYKSTSIEPSSYARLVSLFQTRS